MTTVTKAQVVEAVRETGGIEIPVPKDFAERRRVRDRLGRLFKEERLRVKIELGGTEENRTFKITRMA